MIIRRERWWTMTRGALALAGGAAFFWAVFMQPPAPTSVGQSQTLTPTVAESRPVKSVLAPSLTTADADDAAEVCARILRLPVEQRLAAATELLVAAAEHPGRASRLARRLCQEDPSLVREHGNTLVAVLGAQHEFEAALAFAELGGPERSAWLQRCLEDWVREDPVAALRATLAQPGAEGLPEVAARWAERDPAAAADCGLSLPAETRVLALAAVLPIWIQRQPLEAAAWLAQLEPSPELDGSLAALALRLGVSPAGTEVAFDWTTIIVDPEIRRQTQLELLRHWATADPEGVRHHVARAGDLAPKERTFLLAWLNGAPD